MRSSPTGRTVSARAKVAIGLCLILLASPYASVSISQMKSPEDLSDIRISESSSRTNNLIDVPSWKVNDAWSYTGTLDVRDFVTSSGVSTNVEYLLGTLTEQVSDIYTMNVDGTDTLVYRVDGDGYYEAQNINLDGNNGDLIVEMSTEEIVRVSDLAVIEQNADFDIDFDYQIWWWSYTVHVADLTVDQTYSPPLEGYDFPISVGDEWQTDYSYTIDYSGSSDYVTIPSDSSGQNSTSWDVVSQGFPGVTYGGCSQSYNITNYDDNGDEIGYKWFCPAIRGDVRSSYTNTVGFVAEHELTTYQPAGRPKKISVDLEFPLSPLDYQMSAWVNVTNSGQPSSGETLQVRYESGGVVQDVTTAANGSAFLTFDTGHSSDDSDGVGELGSHGLIAWISGQRLVGVSTVIIDPDVHEVDLVSRSEGVTVERTRANNTVTLDSNVGFNAIPLDQLTFSVPVVNRGIALSPPTTLEVEAPDGSTSSTYIPGLRSLEEMRVEVIWTVPENQPFGEISLTFTADPDEQVASDGNRTNNQGTFGLFIGRLPTASLSIPSESLTLSEVSFNGVASYDSDGGEVSCEFTIEKLDGSNWTSTEDDCIQEYTWGDDGTFLVSLVVTDDENDRAHAQSYITILNRPPEVEIGSDQNTVPVQSAITFDIDESGDSDTQNPDAPIDIEWSLPCEEGQVGERCTVTPQDEGPFTIGVTVMDDDGDTAEDSLTIEVTNIAPSDPRAEIWFAGNRMVPQILGENARYIVNEGDVLSMRGFADDSPNDLDSLEHHWSPDAEQKPDLILSSMGHQSEVQHIYETSGQHLATLQVVDDDGASTETLIIQFVVYNIVPSILPVSNPLPVAEGGVMQFSVEVSDSPNDLPGLISCFDLDPNVNSDSEGNATDDCDVESQSLAHSWEDATTAPSSIVFHVTDDDGASASVVIPVQINNLPPTPAASASEYKPTEGDVIVLSANGTSDSEYDLENMLYVWDLDIDVDSDGDGDPSNDVDMQGRWIEVSFSQEGTKNVRMTAFDEGEGASVTLSIQVQKEPFGLSTLVADYGVYIGLVALIAVLLVVLLQRMRAPQTDGSTTEKADLLGRRKGRKVSMDDAFDDPDYDPFDEERSKDGPKKMDAEGPEGGTSESPLDSPEESGPEPIDPELSDAFEELGVESTEEDESELLENVAVSVDEALDNEDIEALFDD